MGKKEVEEYFRSIGREDLKILEFDRSSATVELAAQAVGVAPELIAKTLTYDLKDGRHVIIVASGTARVSNRKFKDCFGCKARMMDHEEALRLTGHAVGGVCPFGLKTPVEVYLDESLKQFEYVYPAAGEANNAVKIRVDEFASLTGGRWIDVCGA
ncbi:MAG: YbaK/EbsC family protein [Firmicutes bacterium]|nr:YbaK/EbsC family protein [Bacillota bacterium]